MSCPRKHARGESSRPDKATATALRSRVHLRLFTHHFIPRIKRYNLQLGNHSLASGRRPCRYFGSSCTK